MISIKVKKPKPLKADYRTPFKAQAQAAADAMAADMDKLTRYWNSQVKFTGKITMHRDNVEITAKPASPRSKSVQIFKYIDKGTKKDYRIPKATNKKAKTLFFASKHKAGSSPNSVAVSRAAHGPRDTRRKFVTHPGIKARNWTSIRLREWRRKRKLSKYGLEAIRQYVRVSGYQYK